MTATADPTATTTVRAACPHDCPDTCAMIVTVTDGRATEVRGDPEHPFTRGGLCVKVNNYVDKVYSPDRVLHPLRRTGPKGGGRFAPVSWDEALDEVAGRFRAAIDEHGAESIMPVSYLGTEGVLNGLNVGDPFFNRLGATIAERTYCDSGACTAYTMTIGATAGVPFLGGRAGRQLRPAVGRQGSNEHQPGGIVDPLPHYVPPRETADTGYRLNLISPKSHAYLNSSAADQPLQRRVQGEQAVTIHPDDAAERGIADGQYVRVWNDRGQFVALADVSDAIATGVVMCPMGAWPRNSKDQSTVNAVNPFRFADLGNAPTFSDTRVEVEAI